MKHNKKLQESEEEKKRKNLEQVHRLAVRLPWFSVAVALFTWIAIILWLYVAKLWGY